MSEKTMFKKLRERKVEEHQRTAKESFKLGFKAGCKSERENCEKETEKIVLKYAKMIESEMRADERSQISKKVKKMKVPPAIEKDIKKHIGWMAFSISLKKILEAK